MIAAELRTVDLPVAERFGFWHDFTADTVMPTEISSDHADDFRATMRALDLGAVQVSAMTYPSMEIFRTAKLIRRSDPMRRRDHVRGEPRITSVAAWIRSQWLEGCQRDLADPALRLTSIHRIAARWGFSHPAVFSRAFRGAYGLSPREYRQQALGSGAAVTEPCQDGVEGLEGKK
jgi:AraC-like DNA-binding protein